MAIRMTDKTRTFLVYSAILLFAFLLRAPHFTSVALIGPDSGEYVFCVTNHYLPHSPYLLHHWVGWFLHLVVPLDWGYAALSMVSSLLGIFFFGLTLQELSGSRIGGWTAALALAIVPVHIRFAGFQEVYSFQMFWIALSWWVIVCQKNFFLGGLVSGAAFVAHNGTVFAFPTTLLLLWSVWSRDRKTSFRETKYWKELVLSMVRWGLGAAIPLGFMVLWLFFYWIWFLDWERLPWMVHFLRGLSPSPNLNLLIDPNHLWYWKVQLLRSWNELAFFEVIGTALLVSLPVSLLLLPPRKSLPWWLLFVPYLIYESTFSGSLDAGIYLVFVAPAIAASLGLCAASAVADRKKVLGWIRGGVALAGIAGGLLALPAFQHTATVRNLYPWIQKESAAMALSEWVRENATEDTLVIQPVDWDQSGMSTSLYTQRISIDNDGTLFTGTLRQPIFTHPVFESYKELKTEDFEKWLDEEQPVLTYDSNPFTSWGCNWPFVDIDRYETRPILWLDRNQSGTSLHWKGVRTLAIIDIANPTDEERFKVDYPEEAGRGEFELPVYRPTLHLIARKTDPPEHPQWAEKLAALVPPEQRGGPPKRREDGVIFEFKGEGLVFQCPTEPRLDHVIRLTLNSWGEPHAVECQIRIGDRWRTVDRDMEKIVVEPLMSFADLYFEIPGKWIDDSAERFRLIPILETQHLNAYSIEVGVRVNVDKEEN